MSLLGKDKNKKNKEAAGSDKKEINEEKKINEKKINEKKEKKKSEMKEKLNKLKNMNVKDIGTSFKKFQKETAKNNEQNKKRVVAAVDVGMDRIKIAEGMYYRGKLTIDNFVIIKTPEGSMEEGEIKDKEAVASAIKGAIVKNGIKATEITFTTSPTALINREIIVPKVSEEELNTVVRYEIQQYLPINLDECLVQSTFLGEIHDDFEDNEKQILSVSVYPSHIAKEYYQVAEMTGLKPFVLDINYNAVNKFINHCNLIDPEFNIKQGVAFIDFGFDFIDVNIYKNGKLDFTRRIKQGSGIIDQRIKNIKNCDDDEVMRIKRDKVNLNKLEEANDETKIVQEEVDEWIEQIQMIFQFYKNSAVGNDVEKIFAYGGNTKIKGFSNYLSHKLLISVLELKNVYNVSFKSREFNGPMLIDYINAAGALIRETDNDLNFFKDYEVQVKNQYDDEHLTKLLLGGVGIIVGLTLIWQLASFGYYKYGEVKYNNKYNAPQLQKQLTEAEIINDKITIYSQYAQGLETVVNIMNKSDIINEKLINDISGTIPAEIYLTAFKIENDELIMDGTSTSENAVAEFEHNLKNLAQVGFAHVENIETAIKESGNEYRFTVTTTLKVVD